MEMNHNGMDVSDDGRFVDRVEETISVPADRHYTKAELKVTSSEASSEHVISVDSSFKETAYLNSVGQNGKDMSNFREGPQSIVDSENVSGRDVNIEGHSKVVDVEANDEDSVNLQAENYTDRVETILSDTEEFTERIKVTSQSSRLNSNSQQEASTAGSGISASTVDATVSGNNIRSLEDAEREMFYAEANVQPLVTVDPRDILGYDNQNKKDSDWAEFLSMKQKREGFGLGMQNSEFEAVLQEQQNAQEEKERREQKLMEKILGTIPAYRADWEQKTSVGQENPGDVTSYSTEISSEFLKGQQSAIPESLTSTADMKIKEEIRETATSELLSSSYTSSSALTDKSVSLESLEKAVLAQGSVMEPSSLIEVERKFVLTERSEEKLAELGATLLSEKTFHDTYYDTSNYKLILNDIWLRKRDNQWQLKTPVQGMPLSSSSSTQYNEFTNEREIIAEISNLLSLESAMSSVSLRELVQIGLLVEFCSFSTARKSYGLEKCTIDLDLASFGVKVGEIEVVVVDGDHIPDALETIDDMAKKLEFQPYAEANLQLTI